jgi:precorrin-6B C5,15-methyltransferase / cobalt-precorrin-6B C5,C15-methyltransferase
MLDTPIQVVGIGLDGAAGLTAAMQLRIARATVLVGSARHLGYFADQPADRIVLGDLASAIDQIWQYFKPAVTLDDSTATDRATATDQYWLQQSPLLSIVILVSGDPLFFGLGRLLLAEFPADWITFHPHLSSVQLAFNRLKLPWQDARVISAHGRSLDELIQALQQGVAKIAVLTDGVNTPTAIAQLLPALDLPTAYRVWVCENLGAADERLVDLATVPRGTEFAPLNVVVLQRLTTDSHLDLTKLPQFGLPDQVFLSFPDRPGLMTKREVRLLVLGELALQPGQVVWDIGAGTGSVAIEIARLCPSSHIYAVEQTAMGIALIQQNCQRFQVANVQTISGAAPAALGPLPDPDRIFIGGSGGNLAAILPTCCARLAAHGTLVLALATLEHQMMTVEALKSLPRGWQHRLLQAQLARSTPIASLTRWTPLNPVTIVTLTKVGKGHCS